MTSVHHHLDHATVLRYAAGDLDEAFSVVVASHLAMCPVCRRAVAAAEDVGGQLLEDDGEADLDPGLLDRVMAGLDDVETAEPTPAPRTDGEVPYPLQRFVGGELDAISWRPVAPGIKRHSIRLGGSSSLYLLNIGPGKAMPEHGHGGQEMTLILSGAYRDAIGRFGPGDIADLDVHVEHQPVVEPDEACICLVATEAPTRFKDVVSRLLQPIVRI